jgi:hypothetical protein
VAKRLRSFKFTPTKSGHPEIYPWDTWLDGSIWELKRDVDFKPDVANFRSMATSAAKKRGLKVHTAGSKHDPVVVIQAYKPEK